MPRDSGRTSGLKKRDLEVVCWSSEAWEWRDPMLYNLAWEAKLAWDGSPEGTISLEWQESSLGEDHLGMPGNQAEQRIMLCVKRC